MCLAMYRPKGVKVEEGVYRAAFENNDDGGGFAYVGTRSDGTKGIIIEKGFMNIHEMLEALKPHEGKEMLIHFRRVSVGEVCKDNCHPFGFISSCRKEMSWAIMHNGTLPYAATGKKSDTHSFVEDVMEPHLSRDSYFLEYEPGIWMLEQIIGVNNKIVAMRHDAKSDETQVYIMNKSKGTEAHGCWMSNFSYIKRSYTPPVEHGHGHWGNDWYGRGRTPGAASGVTGKDYDLRDWFLNKATGMWEKKSNPSCATAAPATGQPASNASMSEKSIVARVMVEAGGSFERGDDAEPDAVKPEDVPTLAEQEAAEAEALKRSEGFSLKTEQPVIPESKPIEVPRDDDVKPNGFAGTEHLSRKQIGKMRYLATEYIVALGLGNHRTMTFIEKLSWMRDDLRKGVTECETMTDQQIDAWILTKVATLEEKLRQAQVEAKAAQKRAEHEARLRDAQKTN